MRFALPAVTLVFLISATAGGGLTWAGPALDDDAAKRPPSPTTEPDCTQLPNDPHCRAVAADNEVDFGVGVRLRSVWVPKPLLELFVARAAGGAHNYGIGVDLTRRRGPAELQLGFEYERITIGQGVWINQGDDVAAMDEADYVLGPSASGHQFGWFTLEFTFLYHSELTPWLSLRYGGGLGLGILTGEIDHYNIKCMNATNSAPEPGCVPPRFGGTGAYSEGQETQVAYDLRSPVYPVFNAILGLQFKPTDKTTINLEGGLRTIPFLGISTSVFF